MKILQYLLCAIVTLFLYFWLLVDLRSDQEKVTEKFDTYWNNEFHHDTCRTLFLSDKERIQKSVDVAYFAHRHFKSFNPEATKEIHEYLKKRFYKMLLPKFWLDHFDSKQKDLGSYYYFNYEALKHEVNFSVLVNCELMNSPINEFTLQAFKKKVYEDIFNKQSMWMYYIGNEYKYLHLYLIKDVELEFIRKRDWSKKVGNYFCSKLEELGASNRSCPADSW